MAGKSNVKADEIKRALSKRHMDDLFLTEVKTGATWSNKELLKFDAFAIKKSWAKPRLTGYEVKVSRSDFLQDEKWPGYLPHCHCFSFVCPKGLIAPEELTDGVGLIWYYPDTGALVTKRPAKYRLIDIPADLLYYILLSRTDSDRHPFFSDRREMIESYLTQKEARLRIGQDFKGRLFDEISGLRTKVKELEDELRYGGNKGEQLTQIKEAAEKAGINTNRRWWPNDVVEMLGQGMHPDMKHAIERIKRNVDEMTKLVEASGQ
ncbi:hypothetical protein P9G84_31890 [Brevibacillus centrosporus]|uniref:hypothetical protein n=1 Tax=Brevibacillus centrosporus TaxID=54910 RepID=UPI000F09CB7C|nr:hypothetical protein [Brevibacillus centrosporus]MEC2133454.1 hypothetical protein [Brevibacillus centrosporus]RNB63171.1 hypothetical protein EDM55_29350 [Brevibacillus centrosporus]GED35007.1 hypothetical protein BCE02nite_61480 [Brevibacillus centrosporus]